MARTGNVKASMGNKAGGTEVEETEIGERPEQVMAPGMQAWRTKSKLLSGESLNQMSKYDNNTGLFSQKIDILHDDAFVLNSLFMTEGPLKGKHVLVLDPIQPLSFLDFPAEIRVMIYRLLMVEQEAIRLTTYTPSFGSRRIVRPSFFDNLAHTRNGYIFSEREGKYLDQSPSNFAIASVSKLIAAEAASVMYGDNVFEFEKLTRMGVFINRIGSMSKHVKYLSVVGCDPYAQGKRLFNQLFSTSNLYDLRINYRAFCKIRGDDTRGKGGMQKFFEDIRAFLRDLKMHVNIRNRDEGHDESVLDVIRPIKSDECGYCPLVSGMYHPSVCLAPYNDVSACTDDEVAAVIERLDNGLSAAIAKELRVKS